MTTFDDREKAFEAKFAKDEDLRFKVEARRDKIVAHWAAEKLGKTGDEAEEYVRSIIRADLEEPGSDDVFRKLRADLPKADVSDAEIRKAMADALAKAMDEFRTS
ncbi:DUF1476 domain-containing protein [Parvularcula lutaonensis]|uniref:DUF1476 domain-containing protein n=1 Tax=Parvularcula lutaonensis TaxID=491923 RepID=A0ABV7MAT9_9PROT|nr:DUF1476 domain-containing protein [Parvularcula lutaonensis]GGY38895.1 aldolase [Parvularcula lutaonensis]